MCNLVCGETIWIEVFDSRVVKGMFGPKRGK
jgi:hypothetical protein